MAVRRRSAAEWRELVDGLVASGWSKAEYARHVGVHPGTLGWWRWRFGREARPREERSLARFAQVVVAPDVVPVPDFVVELAEDLRVRVPPGFDATELRRLLAALC
jgi:hypothetical protein